MSSSSSSSSLSSITSSEEKEILDNIIGCKDPDKDYSLCGLNNVKPMNCVYEKNKK
jgi:hypothetical protein